jgi:hypothetical protein
MKGSQGKSGPPHAAHPCDSDAAQVPPASSLGPNCSGHHEGCPAHSIHNVKQMRIFPNVIKPTLQHPTEPPSSQRWSQQTCQQRILDPQQMDPVSPVIQCCDITFDRHPQQSAETACKQYTVEEPGSSCNHAYEKANACPASHPLPSKTVMHYVHRVQLKPGNDGQLRVQHVYRAKAGNVVTHATVTRCGASLVQAKCGHTPSAFG